MHTFTNTKITYTNQKKLTEFRTLAKIKFKLLSFVTKCKKFHYGAYMGIVILKHIIESIHGYWDNHGVVRNLYMYWFGKKHKRNLQMSCSGRSIL